MVFFSFAFLKGRRERQLRRRIQRRQRRLPALNDFEIALAEKLTRPGETAPNAAAQDASAQGVRKLHERTAKSMLTFGTRLSDRVCYEGVEWNE